MDQFRKILVSVDATHRDEVPTSLIRAMKLARDTGAELRIVDVVPRPTFEIRTLFHGKQDAADLMVVAHEACLQEICKQLDFSDITWSWQVIQGRPFVELIREAHRHNCDLILRNASAGKTIFFGSLDMRLMRNSPCPVWMVKPAAEAEVSRVLAAIDPFPESSEEEEMNRQILDVASSLAEWGDAELHMVSSWEVRGEALLISKMRPEVFQEHLDGIEAEVCQNLHRLQLQNKTNKKAEVVYKKGDAATCITNYAQRIDADVIVMGTLARTGIPGMLIGNTAERVLRQVRCSVLTIKPSGFKSPVISLSNAGMSVE